MLEYLTREEASGYLTQRGLIIGKTTLQKMATVGGGPVYSIFGNRAVYTHANLDAWAEAKLTAPRTSTSDAAELDAGKAVPHASAA
ncbi:MAG: DNA-binding protein [Methyloceanibacter sp.]|nr:DNA-binding protein [Methyloceanibacter sp.]